MPGLAALSCVTFFAPTMWKAGDLAVEVDQASATVRILAADGSEYMAMRGIESLAYVLSQKERLSLTGVKGGQKFVMTFQPGGESGQILAETSYPGNGKASALLDTYEFDPGLDNAVENGGLAPYWSTPLSLRSGSKGFAAIWPDPAKFDLATPMLGFVGDGAIGYKNATPSRDGRWADSPNPRPYPGGTSYTYVIQAGVSENPVSTVLSSIWKRASSSRRNQAFPQVAPMAVCVANTLKFDRLPFADPFQADAALGGGPSRWEQFNKGQRGKTESSGGGEEEEESGGSLNGDYGFPAGQGDTITLTRGANAMRAAVAMDGLGIELKQADWRGRAIQLVNLITAGSPPDGFAAKITVGPQEVNPPNATNPSSSPDEAATAFYAVNLISQSPGHPETADLTPRILGVLSRMPAGEPAPEFAALVAAAAHLPGLPAEIRQAAIGHSVALEASFAVTSANSQNPWTLEALLWMRQSSPAVFDSQIANLVTRWLLRQSVFDLRNRDGIASFGAFRTGGGEIGPDSPTVASLVGRAGIALGQPEWLDRAAFALRANHSLYASVAGNPLWETLPGVEFGTAAPGFGNETSGFPDRRATFESAEGLLVSATYELLRESGGAYEFENGQTVGVDGLGVAPDGLLRNTLFSNPEPFLGRFQWPGKGAKSTPPAAADVPGWPSIAHLSLELREGRWFAVALPGLTFTQGSERPRGDFFVGNKRIPATLGSKGFEAALPIGLSGPVRFSSMAGGLPVVAESALPDGSPIAWAVNALPSWRRTGDLRWQSSPITPGILTTAESGAGSDLPWLVGEIKTPWLTASGKTLTFTAKGSGDCDIVLLDLDVAAVVATWYPGEKKSMAVAFDLSPIQGHRVAVAIRDRDREGWIQASGFKVQD